MPFSLLLKPFFFLKIIRAVRQFAFNYFLQLVDELVSFIEQENKRLECWSTGVLVLSGRIHLSVYQISILHHFITPEEVIF